MERETEKKEKAQWDSKSIGSHFQHQIFYFFLRVGGHVAAYALLYPVVFWYVVFFPSIRKRCSYYLKRRFPEHSGFRYFFDCFKMCLMLGKTLIDRSIVAMFGSGRIQFDFPEEEKEKLKALCNEGNGLILINSHIGCWQAAMSELDMLDRVVTLLIHKAEGDVDKHYYEQSPELTRLRIVDPMSFMGGTLELLKALQQSGIVGIMGDRVFGNMKNSVEVDFLGGKVALPISPYKLSANSGAPCVVFQTYKTGSKKYTLRIASVIRVPVRTGMKNKDFQPFVQDYANCLERYCEQHPYQFLNFFDMWNV